MKKVKTGIAIAGFAALAAGLASCSQPTVAAPTTAPAKAAPKAAAKPQAEAKAKGKAKDAKPEKVTKIVKTEAEWKKLLSPEAFHVLREKGTQRPFQGDYHPRKEIGVYRCAACNLDLYQSKTKFDSGTGWPSFWQPIAGHVEETTDADGERIEVTCARCGGHLGHVFDDGPKPTGLRYCMNAISLKFGQQK